MKKEIKVEVKKYGLWLDADITYGQSAGWFGHITHNLNMSIIRPFEGQEKPMPCIVWVCGGGWMQMDYNAHLPNLVYFAERGYVVASVEYRCDVQFPEHLKEIKSAIRYLRANAGRYNIDPNKIGVMGESAGGHLTGLIGTTGQTREFDEGDNLEYSSAVQAACPWYMISDLNEMIKRSPMDVEVAKHMLGFNPLDEPEKTAWASPIDYVNSKTPPFLLLHGTADNVVPFAQSEAMYEKLDENGVSVDLYALKGVDHAQVEFFQPEIKEIIAEFFDKYLKK